MHGIWILLFRLPSRHTCVYSSIWKDKSLATLMRDLRTFRLIEIFLVCPLILQSSVTNWPKKEIHSDPVYTFKGGGEVDCLCCHCSLGTINNNFTENFTSCLRNVCQALERSVLAKPESLTTLYICICMYDILWPINQRNVARICLLLIILFTRSCNKGAVLSVW